MKLRLFAIRHAVSRQLQPGYYDNKKDAHAERDRLNGGAKTPNPQYCVTRGPDHRHFNPKA